METVIVQINNSKAYQLLEDLEDRKMITLLKKSNSPVKRLSEKYMGVFSEQDALSFNDHTKNIRAEWSNS